jgi:hypothetical protein
MTVTPSRKTMRLAALLTLAGVAVLGAGQAMKVDASAGPGPAAAVVAPPVPAVPAPSMAAWTEDALAATPAPVTAPVSMPAAPPPLTAAGDQAAGRDCPAELSLTKVPGGLILVDFSAPCAGAARLEIAHAGLRFSDRADPDGGYQVLVPVMGRDAEVAIRAPGGVSAAARLDVPADALLPQVALQWTGAPGMSLHARENGAGYDDPGHVWAGAPRDVLSAVRGQGGFLTELGDPSLPRPRMAQVYTFAPATAGTRADITVEADVTETNCGRDIAAELVEQRRGGTVATPLAVSVPGCGAAGGILVLKKIGGDLKIATK